MFDANTTIPYSPLVYGGRAITMREVKGNLKLNILGNNINNSREGIYCINVKAANNGDVNIGATGAKADDFSNRIYMQMPAALINAASPHYGINMLNCEMAKVASNYVEWNTVPTLAHQSLTRGMSIIE
jgi:hypothetical protein